MLPLSLAATILQNISPATVAKLLWMKKIRHDKAIEKYQAAYEKWQEDRTELLDWVAEQDRIKDKARHDFQDTDQALGSISSRFVRPRSFAHTTAGSLVCPIVFSTNQRLACTNRACKSVIGQFSLVNNKDGGYLCGKIC